MTVDEYNITTCDKSNFNNFSPVTIVRLSNIKIVICGDNETASFEKLMNQLFYLQLFVLFLGIINSNNAVMKIKILLN